jgi:hypothetical protein
VCNAAGVAVLAPQLSTDTLRVENEYDVVPFLPFRGGALGDKLWLLSDSNHKKVSSRYVPRELIETSEAWVNWSLFNFYAPEMLLNAVPDHRHYTYRKRIGAIQREQEAETSLTSVPKKDISPVAST